MTKLPRPEIKTDSSWSAIWILPVLALCLGAWLLWRAFSEAGIEIQVHFSDGEGIQVGKTQVIYKGISLGKVIDLKVSPDLQGVNAKIEINREAKQYLSQATRFWLVKPRVSLAGVTGLETIVSGIYIAIDPVRGDFTQDFSALAEPPPLSDRLPGLHLTLKADRLGSLEQGSPVYYRQIQVGQIKSYKLTENQRTVEIQVYIEPAYTHLVKQHTRFWNASGINVSGGLSGFKVRSESLLSLASGGISFITPEHYQESPVVDGSQPFHLYEDYEDAEIGLKVRVKLKDVSGMQAGRTPVIYNGIQVGMLKWIDTGLDFSQPIAELNMDPRTEELLLASSEFWVVKPSVSLAGINGLDALIQGNYLAVRFGKEGKPVREFIASAQAPTLANMPGLNIILVAERLGSIEVGSPLLFKQIRIGSVQGYKLSEDKSKVLIYVNIEPEYKKIVNQSTRFWNASGVRLKASLTAGVEFNSDSLQTLLIGGIALDTPDLKAPALSVEQRLPLFDTEKQAQATGIILQLNLSRAEGISEGTALRYRGVDIGYVERVRLNDNLDNVVLDVRVTTVGEKIARTGSQFWVIRPEVSLMRVSNLDSVVSGPYLEVEPALHAAAVQTRFQVQEAASREQNKTGLRLVLSASRRGSLHPGVAVTYREITVGHVTRVELSNHADRVLVHILIDQRYAPLVRGGSRFWNSSGVGVDLSLFKGAQIRTESLEAMLQGGIAFATPDEMRIVQPGQTFLLFDEPQPEWLQWTPKIDIQP